MPWNETLTPNLRRCWELGLSGEEAARELGLPDPKGTGRIAVYRQAKKHRDAAIEANNKEEKDFWTRGYLKDGTNKTSRRKSTRNGESRNKPPASRAAQKAIDDVRVERIPWPTDEQVNAETARLITAAAKAEV